MIPILSGNVASALPTGYNVDNSCRFNDDDSAHMHITRGSAGNQRTFTISMWIKRGNIGSSNYFFTVGPDANTNFVLYFDSNDQLEIWEYKSSAYQFRLKPKFKFRDIASWYHLCVTFDTTQATNTNRVKFYVNGTQYTDFDTTTWPSEDYDTLMNDDAKHWLGRYTNQSYYYDGYLAEVVVLDGTAATPTSFGEFDSDSPQIFKPIDVSGLTFGTNGFYLDFEDSSNLGNDANGGTDFTEVNLAATDQATDTPTNNFATWNPLWSQSNGNIGDVVFSEGNLKTTTSAHYRTFPATIGFSSGKWYWEIKRIEDDGNDMHTGVMSENATPANTATWIGSQANAWIFAGDDGSTYIGGVNANNGYTDAGSANDIVSVAFDADNGKIYFGVNGTWQGSADPASGTNPAYSSLDTSLYYFPCTSTGSDVEGNFGNPSFSISSGNADANGYGNFEYAVPSGYYALCTKNLAEYG